ncbi:MAG TPA: hypothetical protein V6C52_02730 [Coleofasciculaceae cyanobacterium]|jgi:hypothetical protein
MDREVFWHRFFGHAGFVAGLPASGVSTAMAWLWKREPIASPEGDTYAGRPIQIHVIDIFTPNTADRNFNHGETTSGMILSGSTDTSLVGKMVIHRYNVGQPAGSLPWQTDDWAGKIALVLETIIAKARLNPASVDAVNVSLQDFDDTPNARRVRKRINELLLMGIPVAVAAGNLGPEARNTLMARNAFVVSSTEGGALRPESGKGNVRAEGRSTSFATAAVTPLLARARAEGKSLSEIRQRIQREMTLWGDTLPPARGEDVFGDFPTELRPLTPGYRQEINNHSPLVEPRIGVL